MQEGRGKVGGQSPGHIKSRQELRSLCFHPPPPPSGPTGALKGEQGSERHGTTQVLEGLLGCWPSEAGLERWRWEAGSTWSRGWETGICFLDSGFMACDLLQPPEARAAWKHSWAQASLGNGCAQAGRQRLPIDREIQVSKEPSGSLATGAEVGQCPQLGAVSFSSSALIGKGTDPHSLGPGPHPGLPPLLTGEVSTPLSSLRNLRLQEVTSVGHPTQPGSSKAEMEARFPHLSGPGPSIRQMF